MIGPPRPSGLQVLFHVVIHYLPGNSHIPFEGWVVGAWDVPVSASILVPPVSFKLIKNKLAQNIVCGSPLPSSGSKWKWMWKSCSGSAWEEDKILNTKMNTLFIEQLFLVPVKSDPGQ